MAELEYSSEALNALNKFYRCDTIVYVEGDDDELFWTTIFERCGGIDVVAKSVGGCSELDKYITRIVEEDIRSLVARDADFLVCCGKALSDPRIVYTYGYSIENTLYTEAAISQIAKIWCKGKRANLNDDCSKWINEFHLSIEELVTFDAANFLHDLGLSVIGGSVSKFAKKPDSHEIDKAKLEQSIKSLSKVISKEMRDQALHTSSVMGRRPSAWIRGHFLASAVQRFISSKISEVGLLNKMSNDALYATAIQAFENSFDSKHPHFLHYKNAVNSAIGVGF